MHPIRQAPLPLPLSLLLPLLLLLSLPCWSLDVGRLCAIRCKLGKGGNLCHCNAFHFAGKRADVTRDPNDSRPGQETPQLGPGSLLRMALRDVEERVKEAPARALDVITASSSRANRQAAREGLRRAGEGDRGGFSVTGDGGRGEPRLGGGGEGTRGLGGGEGGRRGAGRTGKGRGLFGSAEEDEEEEEEGAEEVLDRLTSLIKIALDERLVDRYEASRKLSRGALPYEEEDLVY